jgi:hypothetical protein
VGKYSWTDDQLFKAVTRETSWRGVLRALGLKATSTGSMRAIQQRAAQLGLDTTHFRRNRKWSDRQLRDAMSQSTSWREVADRIGLSPEGATELRLKGHAVRMGLDIGHLESKKPRPSIEHLTRESQSVELRNAAPTVAAAWFALRGLPVAIPSEPQEYDLLVTAPDGIHRVQVKSTTSLASNGTWQVGIAQRPDKFGRRIPYDPSNIDVFVVINAEGDLYVIPIEAVAGYTAIYLSAYGDYKVGDVSSLLN